MTRNQAIGNNGAVREQTLAKGKKIALLYNDGLTYGEAAAAAGIYVTDATARYYAQEWAKESRTTLRSCSSKETAMRAYALSIKGYNDIEVAEMIGYSIAYTRSLIRKGERFSRKQEVLTNEG